MSDTPVLGLPYIAPAQAQKHVTHNEALIILDGLVQAAAKSRRESTPPAAPANGERYLVPDGASGAWAAASGKLAFFIDGGWRFLAPREGWRLWIDDEDALIVFDGAAWRVAGGQAATPQSLDHLGINATADAANRLVVSSPATLLNHEGGGHQLKLNKAQATDTASLLFQTGYSGRAEMGTAGGDDFRIKVSADGTTFVDALSATADTGAVTAHQSFRLAPRSSDPATPLDGELWYNSASKTFRKRENGATSDLTVPAGGGGQGAAGNVSVLKTNLAADFVLPQFNTQYDIVSVDLEPGTWMIFALAHFLRTVSNSSVIAMRLTDGETVYGTVSMALPGTANWLSAIPLNTVVTVNVARTLKLQVTCTLGITAVIKAAFPANATGPATSLTAVRIA